MKEAGLYDNSIFVLYGDHYGISENHNEAMGQFLNKEITPFEEVQLQKVPFVVHIPGVTDQHPKEIDTVGGQVDIRPTVLNLLGIDTSKQIQFGHDLLSKDKNDFTVLRDGSFITKDSIFTDGVCYNKETGDPADDKNVCQSYEEKAKQELQFSDQIIYGDLLRFYDRNSPDHSPSKKKMKRS